MKTLLCLLFAALTLPAVARIGESKEQCVARYGVPKASYETPDHQVWKLGEMIVAAYFIEGKCERLEITKDVTDAITRAEAELLVEASSEGMKWRRSMTLLSTEWQRSDGATATCSSHQVNIETPRWANKLRQDAIAKETERINKEAAEAREKLKGF